MTAGPVVHAFRVRYSETDQMGTFYNSRALEWFEVGRTELLRAIGVPYASMEQRGVMLPLTEARVEFLGRARYDDALEMTVTAAMAGKASVRFDIEIVHADPSTITGGGRAPLNPSPSTGEGRVGVRVARGWTVHAITNAEGKPTRPPEWLTAALVNP